VSYTVKDVCTATDKLSRPARLDGEAIDNLARAMMPAPEFWTYDEAIVYALASNAVFWKPSIWETAFAAQRHALGAARERERLATELASVALRDTWRSLVIAFDARELTTS
jgi:hypothetical protein